MKSRWPIAMLIALLLPILAACSTQQADAPTGVAAQATTTTPSNSSPLTGGTNRPAGWSDESHSNQVEPNYEVVFPQNKVNEIVITISPENWQAMQENMTELYGERGRNGRGGPGGFGGPPPEGFNGFPPEGFDGPPPEGFDGPPPEGFNGFPPEGFGGPGGGPGGMGMLDGGENPMWVQSTISFNGQTWSDVGIRYKGNSSLRSAWGDADTLKIPFKLKFDEFEDTIPAIDNQRFYGFQTLSFSNNFSDDSAMRDMISYDILAAAGLAASETAYYQVSLDYGEGPQVIGLYTMIEETDDTVIKKYFGEDEGNIYKPSGTAASFAAGTESAIEQSFEKENNSKAADWSDIEKLYEVLHSEKRTSDPEAWRAELEALFNVDDFLKWLAISSVIQHWDSYGAMAHNYYLYNDPDTGQINWISWDHNMVLNGGGMGGRGMGGRGGPGGGMPGGAMPPDAQNGQNPPAQPPASDATPSAGEGQAPQNGQNGRPAWGGQGGQGGFPGGRISSLDRAETGSNWPLIRFLLDDPTYYASYIEAMKSVVGEGRAIDASAMEAKYQQIAELIGPYLEQELGAEQFQTAVQQLSEQTQQRVKVAEEFLASKN
jgi:spore coat protein H